MSLPPERESPGRGLLRILASAFSGVLFGLFLSKLRAPIHDSNEAVQPQDTPRNQRDGGQTTPAGMLTIQSPNDADKPQERRRRKTPWWEIAGFIIALGLLGANWFQGCQTKQAADAAHDSAEAQISMSRAWIVPDQLLPSKPTLREINLEWHNAGKTPAIGVFSATEYFSGDLPKQLRTCVAMEKELKKQPIDEWQLQPFVAENGRYETGLAHLPDWFHQQPISIHGCVWYTDVLSNEERSTEFFYMAAQNKFALPISEGVSVFRERPFIFK